MLLSHAEHFNNLSSDKSEEESCLYLNVRVSSQDDGLFRGGAIQEVDSE